MQQKVNEHGETVNESEIEVNTKHDTAPLKSLVQSTKLISPGRSKSSSIGSTEPTLEKSPNTRKDDLLSLHCYVENSDILMKLQPGAETGLNQEGTHWGSQNGVLD